MYLLWKKSKESKPAVAGDPSIPSGKGPDFAVAAAGAGGSWASSSPEAIASMFLNSLEKGGKDEIRGESPSAAKPFAKETFTVNTRSLREVPAGGEEGGRIGAQPGASSSWLPWKTGGSEQQQQQQQQLLSTLQRMKSINESGSVDASSGWNLGVGGGISPRGGAGGRGGGAGEGVGGATTAVGRRAADWMYMLAEHAGGGPGGDGRQYSWRKAIEDLPPASEQLPGIGDLAPGLSVRTGELERGGTLVTGEGRIVSDLVWGMGMGGFAGFGSRCLVS